MTAVDTVAILTAYHVADVSSKTDEVEKAERLFTEFITRNVVQPVVRQFLSIDGFESFENGVRMALSLLYANFLLQTSRKSKSVCPGPAYGFRYLREKCRDDAHLIGVLRLVLKRCLLKQRCSTAGDDCHITAQTTGSARRVNRAGLVDVKYIERLNASQDRQRLFDDAHFDDTDKTVFYLIERKYTQVEIAQSLGLSTAKVEAIWVSLYVRTYVWFHRPAIEARACYAL